MLPITLPYALANTNMGNKESRLQTFAKSEILFHYSFKNRENVSFIKYTDQFISKFSVIVPTLTSEKSGVKTNNLALYRK